MNLTPIRKLVRKTKQMDPRNLGRDSFIYIDISSIDKDTKLITNPQKLIVDEAPSRARKEIRANDVLVATVRPNLNGVAIVPSRFDCQIASTGFCVLRVDYALLDPQYLFYFVQTNYLVSRLTMLSIGAGYPAVSDDNILDSLIPLPPLQEQRRIAGILAKADRLRRLRRTARQLSDTYLQSVFMDMFGDTLLGLTDIPLVPLEEVCSKITDGTHVTPKYLENGIPFVSIKDLTKIPGQIDFSDVKYISRAEHEWISKLSNVEKGDILYTKVGSYGIAQLVNTEIEFSIFVSIALLKPDKSKIIPKFFESVLKTDFIKRQADRLVSGIGVPDLHLREIKTFVLPLPPMNIQKEFVEIALLYERFRKQQIEASRQSEMLFQSLLQRAFAGEV